MTPIGQAGLIKRFGLRVPIGAVTSQVGPGQHKTTVEDGHTIEKYPISYKPEDTLAGHLKFALKYEPVDLGVLSAVFKAADRKDIEDWVRSEPTGVYSRRAWFIYEWLTGKTLDLPDAAVVAYTPALDPELHFTTEGVWSKRHRVTNNLLGTPSFCPTVRRTPRLEDFRRRAIDVEARNMISGCNPGVLARAVNYLYTKETKSSFEIENEVAGGQRAERFVFALRSTKSFNPIDSANLIALQNTIVDPRYAAKGYRDFQNFVGETAGEWREIVHFICPRPQDVESLMSGWAEMTTRLKGLSDPVVAAALVAFGFVFIHPFEDGNGRIHRFLIHHVLSSEGFSPPDILFPISAAIVRDMKGYGAALETFSGSVQPHIDWAWTPNKEIVVNNDTANLYRYFDATKLAEYLYTKIAETVRKDLREELEFVALYDGALKAVLEQIDMPDRKASLFVRFSLQNGGRLSKNKRNQFPELSDGDMATLEAALKNVIPKKPSSSDTPLQIKP